MRRNASAETKTFTVLTVCVLPRTLSTKQLWQQLLVTQDLYWYDRTRIQNKIQQPQALFQRPKALTWHCSFKTLETKRRKHQLWDQLAHHQKGKRIQRQTISLQPMFSWKTMYLDRSKCLSLKQEIWASNEMLPWKQVLHGNQSEEASLQPFLNLKHL